LLISLKCVATEVGLFSIVAWKTLDISQGSVATDDLQRVWNGCQCQED